MKNRRLDPDSSEAADGELCYQSAMRLLEFRFRSRLELQRRLQQRGYLPEVILSALERLIAEKWLDDRRFAEAFARTRLRKQRGVARISMELAALGVEQTTVRDGIASAVVDEPEAEHLARATEKKARALERRYGAEVLITDEGRNKLTSFLLKQGYAYGNVASAVEMTIRQRASRD